MCDPRFHFRNTNCRGQTFKPTTTDAIFPLPVPRKTSLVRYGLIQREIASIAVAKWYVRSANSLQKHKLPGTNFPADHDRRHISTSGTAKNAASWLRLKSVGNRVDRCRKMVRAISDFTTETHTAGDKLSSLFTCVTTWNLVVLWQMVYASIGRNPKSWGAPFPLPLLYGRRIPLEMRSSACVILPNLFVLRETVPGLLRKSASKFDFLHSAFQGHSSSSEPSQVDPPPIIFY